MKVLMIGFHHYVNAGRIVSILNLCTSIAGDKPSRPSTSIKRYLDGAKERNLFINATSGHTRRSAIVIDSGHIILSALSSGTLSERLEKINAR